MSCKGFFKSITHLLSISRAIPLPGFKCTIWFGWIQGLVLTKSPRNLTVFTSWRSKDIILPSILNVGVALFTLDYLVNILPGIFGDRKETPFFVFLLTQGFASTYVIILGLLRAYLVVNAKPFSSFLKRIEHGGDSRRRNQSSLRILFDGKLTGILLLLLMAVVVAQSAAGAWIFANAKNSSHSWFAPLLGTKVYGGIAVILYIFPSSWHK